MGVCVCVCARWRSCALAELEGRDLRVEKRLDSIHTLFARIVRQRLCDETSSWIYARWVCCLSYKDILYGFTEVHFGQHRIHYKPPYLCNKRALVDAVINILPTLNRSMHRISFMCCILHSRVGHKHHNSAPSCVPHPTSSGISRCVCIWRRVAMTQINALTRKPSNCRVNRDWMPRTYTILYCFIWSGNAALTNRTS